MRPTDWDELEERRATIPLAAHEKEEKNDGAGTLHQPACVHPGARVVAVQPGEPRLTSLGKRCGARCVVATGRRKSTARPPGARAGRSLPEHRGIEKEQGTYQTRRTQEKRTAAADADSDDKESVKEFNKPYIREASEIRARTGSWSEVPKRVPRQ
jgi:hypothetical protein